MIEMLMFAVGVYYTPGPANMIGFGAGLSDGFRSVGRFAFGVGCALLFWFTVVGFIGHMVVVNSFVPYLATLGALYILYLAVKIISSLVRIEGIENGRGLLGFRDGLLLQILNPKGMMVVVPVTGIFFPAQNIGGYKIVVFSLLLSLLGALAPVCYAIFGDIAKNRLPFSDAVQERLVQYFNIAMGLLLVVVALAIVYEYTLPH